LAASTPTLASEPAEPNEETGIAGGDGERPGSAGERLREGERGLTATRLGLAGISVVALLAFALYAAYMASKVEDVIAPVEIVVPTSGAASPLGLGQVAPDFTLTDLEGREVKLSDFRGRPVWINVWASWCAPCRAEMPDIDAVYREQRASGGANGLALLLVSLGEDPAAVRRYMSTTRYELPVLLDPGFAFTERYRITGLPTHYFIDRQGNIKELAIGGLKPAGMRARVARITN
jgi:cytochrome c biogenesis protein CcmG, thiol:disulfide interchange protein DsbE